MSKNTLRLILFSFLLFPVAAFAKDAYQITIKINGYKGQKLLLGYYFGDKQYIKDSGYTDATGTVVFRSPDSIVTTASGKKITMKSREKLQGGIYLIATADKRLLFDFVVTEQEFTLETDTADFVNNMKVKGSAENEAFFAYSKFTTGLAMKATEIERNLKIAKENLDTAGGKKYKEQLTGLDKEVDDYRQQVIKDHPTFLMSKLFLIMQEIKIPPTPVLPNGRKDSMFQYLYYIDHYFDNYDFTDDRIVYTPVFHPKFESYITKLIIQIPDSIIKYADQAIQKALKSKEVSKYMIYWITNHYETSEYMGMDAVFVHMALKYYTNKDITYWVDETLRFKIVDRARTLEFNTIGKVGQNITLPDSTGMYHSLYNIKAEYTLLIFWDPNCGKCKEEVPKVLEYYKEVNAKVNMKGRKKFEVYGLGMTSDPAEWRKYLRAHNLPWINVHDPNHESNFRKHYDVYSTPVLYLLDENKKILAKRISLEQLKEFIEKGIQ